MSDHKKQQRLTKAECSQHKIVLSVLAAMCFLSAEASAMPLKTEVSDELDRLVDSGKARAIVVGVYADGEREFHAFGQLGRNNTSAPTQRTLFEIGSISKVFTALLTQTLVESGKLDWDAPISRYLSGVEFASTSVAAISLRELAAHTSGLPRLPDNIAPTDPLDPYAGYEREHLFSFLADFDPDALEKTYAYSNLGAGLLGVIAADAFGGSYGDAIRSQVLEPLALDATSQGFPAGKKQRAQGFSQGADMPDWSGFDALAGAGALVSNAADQLEFAAQTLKPDALADALNTIQTPQDSGVTGLGWHILDDDTAAPIVWHNGGTGGFASFLGLHHDAQTAVVILAASTEYDLITSLGVRQIGDQPGEESATDYNRFVGAYRLNGNMVLTLFVDGTRLMAQATGQGAFPLQAHGENEFRFDPAGVRIVFDDGDGPADSMQFHQGGSTTRAKRVAESEGVVQHVEVDIDPHLLGDYTGEFELAPGVTLNVVVRQQQLFVQLTGQSAFPVFPFSADRFFYKIVDAQLHFERDDSGKVVAVELHQAGVQRAVKLKP